MSAQTTNDYIREKIKNRREELGMSQEDLARASGYQDKTAISKIERGIVKVDVSKLQIIAFALNVSPQYFFPPAKTDQVHLLFEKHKDILKDFDALSADAQEEVRAFIKFKLSNK